VVTGSLFVNDGVVELKTSPSASAAVSLITPVVGCLAIIDGCVVSAGSDWTAAAAAAAANEEEEVTRNDRKLGMYRGLKKVAESSGKYLGSPAPRYEYLHGVACSRARAIRGWVGHEPAGRAGAASAAS
jgi:hypothetical protein